MDGWEQERLCFLGFSWQDVVIEVGSRIGSYFVEPFQLQFSAYDKEMWNNRDGSADTDVTRIQNLTSKTNHGQNLGSINAI